ncbi:odorant receptor 63a-like [Bactrocera neohumeralis]|uniref:odorant receptor 63a-like n=1 Tax=Bactrocera neohumeralis TaxID=98809 RepID=UPI002166B7D9|nr:odorant receptor 63a-like [Bactrocera neohumeralis]
MYNAKEFADVKNSNSFKIRELTKVSYIIGINYGTETSLKRFLRVLNLFLIIICGISLYPRWLMLERADGNVPLIAETITTMLQTTTTMVKMTFYLFMQGQCRALLKKAEDYELLQGIKIFETDMDIKAELKAEINAIMATIWKETRRQLLSCLITCSCILSNYFLYAFFTNLYHQIKRTPNYVHILPFTGYPMFLEKGMASPYYAVEMFIGGGALLTSGMCSVSFHCIFMILSKHACGLVRVLCAMLLQSTSPEVPAHRREEYLRYCVIQHQQTLRFINDINELFRHITLSHFLHSLAIYGLVLFEMNFGLETNKTTFVRMVMYIGAALTVDSMYYVNGQLLATELEKIPFVCYSCDWFNESKDFKKTLIMIIMRSNNDFQFQISWFGVMSLTTLMGILKASFSYFLILRDMTDEVN